MERQQFDREYKAQAVRMCEQSNVTVAQVARELGINPKLLYRWREEARQAGEAAFPGHGSEDEVKQLRRQLARVEMERDILKKALAILSRNA